VDLEGKVSRFGDKFYGS